MPNCNFSRALDSCADSPSATRGALSLRIVIALYFGAAFAAGFSARLCGENSWPRLRNRGNRLATECVVRLDSLTRMCGGTESHQEQQVRAAVLTEVTPLWSSVATTDRRCWPASQPPIISHPVCSEFMLPRRNVLSK